MEWHIWDFPDNVRIYFTDEFKKYVFETLKKICRSRYRLAKILELHPVTVKQYELGKSTYGRTVFMPVFVLKKLIEILKKSKFYSIIDEIEKHITKMRLKGGKSSVVYNPTLPIKESEKLYSFTAHMMGDGCASICNAYYCGPDRELIESFKKDLEMFGKIETRQFVRQDGTIHGTVYLYFPTVIARIVQHILDVRFTKPNRVPERIFAASNACKTAFLRAFYDDEGCVSVKKIFLTQKSRRILKQIQILLKSLNIQTGKISKSNTGFKFVVKVESYENFYDSIKFEHFKKQKRLENIIIKRRSKPMSIKYRVLDLLKKNYPLTKYDISSSLGLRIESVHEALSSLHEEDKISGQYVSSRKPNLWFPTNLAALSHNR